MSSGGGGGGSAPAIQTQIVREAPGIEERKLGLMDIGLNLGSTPVNIPNYNIYGSGQGSALQQQGLNAAGTTGVGVGTQQAGIASLQQAAGGPNISQFFNPYQSYVTDEITRQGQMQQNQIAGQAVQAGAFGGGREGVQLAENQARTLGLVGQSQAAGFQSALGASQNAQQAQIQTGQALGNAGLQQQAMQQADIQSMLQAGGVQQQLGQQALDATRATELQRAYEPFQRAEFVKNMYAAGPTSQSGITAATTPTANPLAQTVGTGIAAYQAYAASQPKAKV
tara:strand:+ start:318 stop:1163 length:846 start_codon:yes stop_codon:yes gene_type:complete